MQIGSLNKRISIEAPTKVSDGMGGWVTTFKEMASDVAAAIWPISATERIQSMGATGEITHRIRIRYRSDIRTNWRIVYKGNYFNINGPPINTNMANRVLDIMVKAV